MPKVKLTDAFVRSAKQEGGSLTEYSDTNEKGLALRITPAGVKSWTYRYRNLSGQQRRVSLGKVHDVPLAEARKRVVAHRAAVDRGGDPAQERIEAKETAIERHGRETVADVGDWYFAECRVGRHKPNAKAPKRESTLQTETLYYEKHIKPRLGKRKLVDLTRASIQAFVNDLADNASKSAARHCRVVLHGIYAFAQRQDVTDKANPCQHVTVAAHTPRVRVLTDSELKTIWQALIPPVSVNAPISAGVAYSVLLAMVTLQRRAEVTGIRLSEIDGEKRIWLLPPERTKNKRSHTVPLSPLALKLIDSALAARSCESDFVFPSPRGDGDKPIEPQALTRAFVRMKQALELGDVRPHDLRRTGATNLTSEALGFPRFTVSKVLNHTSDTGGASAVTGVYDRNEYLPEKRRALDAWALRLQEIVGDVKRTENIVAFGA